MQIKQHSNASVIHPKNRPRPNPVSRMAKCRAARAVRQNKERKCSFEWIVLPHEGPALSNVLEPLTAHSRRIRQMLSIGSAAVRMIPAFGAIGHQNRHKDCA